MKNYIPSSRQIVPWLALVGLLLLAIIVVTPFIVPVIWASVLAYASWPVASKIRYWCKNRDTLAAFLSTSLAALILFLPLIWLIWLAQQELSNAYQAIQELIANPPPVPDLLRNIPWFGEWLLHKQAALLANPQELSSFIKTWITAHTNDITSLAGSVGKNLVKLIFVVMILFFFYRDGARIIKELRYVLERYIGVKVHGYMHAVASTARAVVYGVLLTAIVQGVFAGFGYWIAGLQSPVLFGVLTMILALIPFGTPIAWGSAGIWLLLEGETSAAIGVCIWGALVVSQLDNFLRPLFISSVSPIPFLFVLFGVLGGLLAFGLVGLFVGPIALSVIWALWREWATHLEEISVD